MTKPGWVVVGTFTPTDATPGELPTNDVAVICGTHEDAEAASLYYFPGTIYPIEER